MIQILHFNDAYKAQSKTGDGVVGGAARFQSLCHKLRQENSLVTCGGDVYNPSLMSTVTKGKHVPPLLNAHQVVVATIGNHDCDFGLEVFEKLSKECDFPWVCSNIKIGGKVVKGCVEFVVKKIDGVTVGFVGIAGTDFVGTLNFDASAMIVEEPVECGNRVSKVLREEHGCDTVVALTHMRLWEDEKVAKGCQGIDLILGAHDHEPVLQEKIAKGGCDWRHCVEAVFNNGKWEVKLHDVTADLEEDEEIKAVLNGSFQNFESFIFFF